MITTISLLIVKVIPEETNKKLLASNIRFNLVGPEYSLSEPKLEVSDNGKLWTIKFGLCFRPHVRTTLGLRWVEDHVLWDDFTDDVEYEKFVKEHFHIDIMNDHLKPDLVSGVE